MTPRAGRRGGRSAGAGGGAGGEDGFVLAAVLLTLVALAVLASAGLVLTRTDLEVGVNHRSSVEAAGVAERGLATYLAEHGRPGPDTTYVFGEDTAEVTLTALLEVDGATGDTLYRLASRGVDVIARGGTSTRTLSRLLHWGGASKPFTAAAAGGGDIDLASDDPVLSGVDGCGAAADVAGAAVATGRWQQHPNQQVSGTPPVDSSYATGSAVLEAAGFDSTTWAGIRSETEITPDVRIVNHAVWPDFDTIAPDRWLVVVFQAEDGRFNDPQTDYSGRGTIITRDDFHVDRDEFGWEGLILAGGQLEITQPDVEVEGAVLAGLDRLLGSTGEGLEIQGSGTRVQYDACNAGIASRTTFRLLSQVPGSWSEAF